MSQQNKYQEELEKYKNVQISLGIYELKNTSHIKYEIISISESENKVVLKTIRTNNLQTKTLHWARKNLIKIEK